MKKIREKLVLLAFLLLGTCQIVAAVEPPSGVEAPTDFLQPEGKLVFAIDIIRHGDRTPTANIPSVPHEWSEGLGQLTPIGMHQEYLLGAHLRSLYVDQYHLLPEKYEPGSVYVRSSGLDRTLVSAESFLMGLEPLGAGPSLCETGQEALPEAYQPLPVHTLPSEQETLLIPDATYYHFDHLLEKYFYPTEEYQKRLAQLQPKFASWSQATGFQITNLHQLQGVGDTLSIDQANPNISY